MLDEAFGIFGEGAVKGGLTGSMDGVGLSGVNSVFSHQSQAGVVVSLVIPGEGRPAERSGVLDAAEALWELRLVFGGLK